MLPVIIRKHVKTHDCTSWQCHSRMCSVSRTLWELYGRNIPAVIEQPLEEERMHTGKATVTYESELKKLLIWDYRLEYVVMSNDGFYQNGSVNFIYLQLFYLCSLVFSHLLYIEICTLENYNENNLDVSFEKHHKRIIIRRTWTLERFMKNSKVNGKCVHVYTMPTSPLLCIFCVLLYSENILREDYILQGPKHCQVQNSVNV